MKALLLVLFTALTVSAQAQTVAEPPKPCFMDPSFTRWIQAVRRDAQAAGITAATWNAAYPQMSWNQKVFELDREQSSYFSKSFAIYMGNRVSDKSISIARSKRTQGLEYLARPDVYGVPSSILLAFWGMESNFADQIATPREGFFNVIQAMTTLAYECRRSEMFRENLLDALQLIQRGDFTVTNYFGKWAGEVSGLQFTPRILYRNGVRYDGNTNLLADTLQNKSDMFATAAKTIKSYGWEFGYPAAQEVIINFPQESGWMGYAEADAPLKTLRNTHPLSYWKNLGIVARNGTLPDNDNMQAALLLPLGYRGPAFLAYPNFNALMGWNNSLNNALTAAYFASRIDSDEVQPIDRRKLSVPYLDHTEIEEIQVWLVQNEFDSKLEADGRLGSGTRLAVRKAQLQARQQMLPPDGYPSKEFLAFVRKYPSFRARN